MQLVVLSLHCAILFLLRESHSLVELHLSGFAESSRASMRGQSTRIEGADKVALILFFTILRSTGYRRTATAGRPIALHNESPFA